MSIGWFVAVIFLALFVGCVWLNRRLQARLRQEKLHVLEYQREMSITVRELSDVKTRRKRLLAASTQALIIVENDYRVSSANKTAKQMFGPLHKKNSTFIEWTRQHQLLELVDMVLANEKPPPLYFSHQDRFLEAHARSIKDQGIVAAVALAIHDVTELQRLSRARRDFVTNISHELRTPLASIQLLIETLLNKDVLDDKSVRFEIIDKITSQVEVLGQLAQELLDLSLIESGRMPLRLSSYSLYDVIEEQLKRLQPQAERKNLSLTLEVDQDIKVLIDQTMVGRVLSNLIHNAIKFTDRGGVTITAIPCHSADLAEHADNPDEAWVKVSISDTGMGLPPDQLSRIFERFYKIDRARKQSGTGLGLAIARHIIEAHGGHIWAENNRTNGVTFYFNLPVED